MPNMDEAATIATTFGALEIGMSVSVFLFGIVTLQVYTYFTRFEDDRLLFRALVSSIWLLEFGHTIAVFYEVYRTTIILYGKPKEAVAFPSIGVVFLLGGLITAIVQGFFSYRLWRLLPKPYNCAGVVTAIMALSRAVLSTYGASCIIPAPDYVEYASRSSSKSIALSLLVMGAIIDVIIAISMVYFLLKTRQQAFKKVTKLLDRLIGFSLRTGLITSLAAISVLVLYELQPHNFIYLAIYTSLAKLYSNTLLSSLNSRSKLRDQISTSTVSVDVPRRKGSNARPTYNHAISIEMKTVTEFNRDDTMSV